MKNESPMAVIWRRKGIIVATFLAFAVTTAIVSKTLEKIYITDSTLLISLPADTQTFDTVQASQAIARSYADIFDSKNIAQRVAERIGPGTEENEILDATKFEPVSETQLLKITAEDPSPERAKEIADTYAEVVIAYAQTNLAETTKATISLADPAPLRDSPARPKPTLYTIVAGILGLALGLGFAFLRDRLDHRLRTAEDVESQFELPVLTRVPRRGRSEAALSAFKEAFRILRTNVQFASVGGRLESIAVTSGGEGDGKTTTVVELGLASAELGLRVLVVEGDFRRPGLQRLLMPDRNPLRPGLSNYLVEAVSLDQVIHSTGRPNLDLVPAGPLPPNPSALLQSERGRTAVRDFLTRADLVLLDSPPLSVGADASVISGWVDGAIVVINLDTSTDRAVRRAIRQLEAVHATVFGLVLNRDRSVEPSSYDYYLTATPATDGELSRRRARERV